MGLKEKIYDNSPIFFQNFMISSLGMIHRIQRYGKSYYDYSDYLDRFEKLNFEEKRTEQFKLFKDFIIYAKQNSRFYAQLYKDIDLEKINSFEDAKILPFTDKELFREDMESVYTIPKKGAIIGFTGGTTGKSFCARFTREDFEHRMAALDCFKRRNGFQNLKMKKATFNAKVIVPKEQTKKVFWRYNIPNRQMIYSTFNITEENLKYYVESLNRFKPDALDGYFVAMCDIASYIERHNIKLTFKPVAIFSTSETITENGRALLERVFGCKLFDQYASSEGAPFVTECKCGKLHIDMASGYIEEIDNDTHEVAVTSFTTHGTPLIRYRIGDCMKISSATSCKCGNESVIVDSIEGRKIAYLYSATGAKITTVHAGSIFKYFPSSVIQSQFVQNKIGEIELNLVVDKSNYEKATEKLIFEKFYERVGRETLLKINYVDSIPRASSGKFRLIVNNIDKG